LSFLFYVPPERHMMGSFLRSFLVVYYESTKWGLTRRLI
jgi:hypothetical protein